MPDTVKIALSAPIVGHKGTVSEVVLKPPGLLLYARIGEVFSVVPDANDKAVVVENDAAIGAYIEACVVEPEDKLLLEQVTLADAMKIRSAVLGFFAEARQASRSPT